MPRLGSVPLGPLKQNESGFTPPALLHTNTPAYPDGGTPPFSIVTLHRIRGDGLMDDFPKRQCNLWHHGSVCTPGLPQAPVQRLLSLERKLPLLGDNAVSIANTSLGCKANAITFLPSLTSTFWFSFAGGMAGEGDGNGPGREFRQNQRSRMQDSKSLSPKSKITVFTFSITIKDFGSDTDVFLSHEM